MVGIAAVATNADHFYLFIFVHSCNENKNGKSITLIITLIWPSSRKQRPKDQKDPLNGRLLPFYRRVNYPLLKGQSFAALILKVLKRSRIITLLSSPPAGVNNSKIYT